MHALVHNDNEPLLALCKEHGIVVEAYSPLVPITKAAGGPVDEIAKRIAKEVRASSGSRADLSAFHH